MKSDPYDEFAERYDLFFEGFGKHDLDYVEFFRSLIKQYGVKKLLDCACGTGQDLHLFHSLGLEVHGSDISEAMLSQARKNLSAGGFDVPLKKVDFRELPRHFNQQFDAVVCLSTSLPHLLEEAEIMRALKSMHQVLRDGGMVVLTQGICDKQLRDRPRFILAINRADFSRVFVMEYFEETMRINVLDLFHSEHKKDFKVSSFDYRIILQDDYERVLSEAGFSEREYYGSYSFDEYDKERSDRLIVTAQK